MTQNKMTNEEILKRAIEKAVENGYKKAIYELCFIRGGLISKNLIADGEYERSNTYFRLIFSHEFCKAFWGEHCISSCCEAIFSKDDNNFVYCPKCNRTLGIDQDCKGLGEAWKFHLQQMVLEPEPLRYLERFL